ncbi:hypothetical protein CEXT_336971 [Caerostris extrusa]|uniref:Uncharacterized protein n=1 Tax=Caerostris extrusa TaxID=172846 RepID=A0AAV4SXH1_CAEEX|nr:hypothetical protein CEXT_336971 [Caerostris extrusa]
MATVVTRMESARTQDHEAETCSAAPRCAEMELKERASRSLLTNIMDGGGGQRREEEFRAGATRTASSLPRPLWQSGPGELRPTYSSEAPTRDLWCLAACTPTWNFQPY